MGTANAVRDAVMKSHFLEASKFPHMKFHGLSWEKGDISRNSIVADYKAKGLVTVRDVEREVEFRVKVVPDTLFDEDEKKLKINVKAEIDRFDFKVMSWCPSFQVGRTILLDADIVAELVRKEDA